MSMPGRRVETALLCTGVITILLGGARLSAGAAGGNTATAALLIACGVALVAAAATCLRMRITQQSGIGLSTANGATAGPRLSAMPASAARLPRAAVSQTPAVAKAESAAAGPLAILTESFTRWSDRQDDGTDLWPAFDRWMRDALNECVGARRVRCFRPDEAGGRLCSLSGELGDPAWLPGSTPGLIEHVLATGTPYIRGAAGNGMVARLADAWPACPGSGSPGWLVPIRERNRTVGLVLIGEVPAALLSESSILHDLAALIAVFWRFVRLSESLAVAERTDQTSGVLTRADLVARAAGTLAESAAEGEPVVILALAVEGVRRLADQGQWELRDRVMREIGAQMRRKLRSDDLVGRFSDDRFVAVLRRLDPALGRMIAAKVFAAVDEAIRRQPGLTGTVRVRCGLTGAAGGDLDESVTRAFEALRQARTQDADEPFLLPAGGAPRSPGDGDAP